MSWQDVKAELIGMAAVMNPNFNEASLKWYMSALEDMDSKLVIQALRRFSKTAKQTRMPTPAEIREMIHPQLNQDNEAREAAARIIQAVSKYGYTNPTDAKVFVGELGWRIVERFGGWGYLCSNLGVALPIAAFNAQARDLAKSTIERGLAGKDEEAPQISERVQKLLDVNK